MLTVVAVDITRKQASIIRGLDSSKRMKSVPEFAPVVQQWLSVRGSVQCI